MDNNKDWQDFLQKLQKDKNPAYDLLKETELDVGENLTIYHPTEEGKAAVEKQRGKIQAKLVKMYPHWEQKKLMVKAGERSLNLDNHKLEFRLRQNFPRLFWVKQEGKLTKN